MLRAVSNELLERDLVVSYWGNVRFEKAFTPELVAIMKAGGCIAVSGGLEVSPRISAPHLASSDLISLTRLPVYGPLTSCCHIARWLRSVC
jgi:hypothetical protein